MFLNTRDPWPPPEPWRAEPKRPRVTGHGERVIAGVIGFNLVMLVVGPLAGATLLELAVRLLRQLG